MRIGFDYGGTKIAGIALDEAGRTLAQGRVPTPRFDYEGGISAIRELMQRLETEAGQRAETVGIGVPGSVDRDTGHVSMGNSVWLHGRDLRGDLRAALDRPVAVANDANCFALSEAVDGAGAGAKVVFGAILGTGVGGGIAVEGRLIEGINAIGGEWGHIPLPDPCDDERPGPLCSCGRPGHTEAWLSGPSLAADHARRLGIDPKDGPSAPEVIALARQGDSAAEETLQRFEDRLGRSLAVIINVLDPDVIVLGGGLSNVDRFYETVPPLIRPHVFGDKFNTRLVPNMHGDSSGVRGAAWLTPPR
ncbi:ROK family protein [Halovulum dunhuangense]|uniref:ROK family protein n=1 Tax=Halovulum dunhuangense TaxID=1505036 RepID=A0A849KTT1_9RHOB|nr:ROK family protein [Halovulum dunhuangense]NNU78941.1 ROK family protein [Halovulum dunhuangense]